MGRKPWSGKGSFAVHCRHWVCALHTWELGCGWTVVEGHSIDLVTVLLTAVSSIQICEGNGRAQDIRSLVWWTFCLT